MVGKRDASRRVSHPVDLLTRSLPTPTRCNGEEVAEVSDRGGGTDVEEVWRLHLHTSTAL